MLQKLVNRGELVHVEVLAAEYGLATAILASGHVELVFAVVKELVIGIEGTGEDFDVGH